MELSDVVYDSRRGASGASHPHIAFREDYDENANLYLECGLQFNVVLLMGGRYYRE
jgi:hypothetical protein